MKLGFTSYNNDNSNNILLLDLNIVTQIIDDFANKKDISTTKHELFIPESIIQSVYSDIAQVENVVINAMQGQNIKIKESTDEQGNVIAAVYYPKPTSLIELKEQVITIINNEFAKAQGNYNINNVEDLCSKIEYIIDKIVAFSKNDGSGDWEFFKSVFKNG